MSSGSRTRLASFALAIAPFAALAVAPAASAQTTSKPYAVTVEAVDAGGRTTAVKATVENRAKTQTIQSIEFTPPAGVTITGGDPAQNFQPQANGRVRWLNQAIAPRRSATYTMFVRPPCGETTLPWGVEPKQSNDFSGIPGNSFGPQDAKSEVTPTLRGACALSWGPEPQDAQRNVAISSVDFTPISSTVPAPAVKLSSPVSGVPVTVTLSPFSAGAGGLAQPSYTVPTDSAGVAVFPNLEITGPGYYRLSAAAPGTDPVVSAVFLVQTDVMDCDGVAVCTDDAAGKQARVKVDVDPGGDAGKLSMSLLPTSVSNAPDCWPYYETMSSEWSLVIGPGATKTIRFEISKQDMNAKTNNGVPTIKVCYSDPAPAGWPVGSYAVGQRIPRSAFWAPTTVAADTLPIAADLDGDDAVDGADWVLAGCGTTGGARPCTLRTGKTGAGVGYADFLAPGGKDDPRSSG